METKIKQYGSIVLNIPHSSTNIPEHFMPEDYGSSKAFYAERYRLLSRPFVDYYTDELLMQMKCVLQKSLPIYVVRFAMLSVW